MCCHRQTQLHYDSVAKEVLISLNGQLTVHNICNRNYVMSPYLLNLTDPRIILFCHVPKESGTTHMCSEYSASSVCPTDQVQNMYTVCLADMRRCHHTCPRVKLPAHGKFNTSQHELELHSIERTQIILAQ